MKRNMERELEILGKNIRYGNKRCQYDLEFAIVEVDDRYAALVGYAPEEKEELTGKSIRDAIHPGDVERIAREVIKSPKLAYDCMYRLRTKSGSYIWVRDIGEVVEEGGMEYVESMVMDIDEQERLRRQRDVTYDSIPGGVLFLVISRDNFYIQDANKHYFNMMKVSREEYLGTSGKYTFPEDLPKMREHLVTQASRHEPIDYEFRIRRGADGTVGWYRMLGNYYESGKDGEQYFCILIDITNRKMAQFDLMKEKEKYRIATKSTADLMYEYDVADETLMLFRENSMEEGTRLCIENKTVMNYKRIIFGHDLIYKGDRNKLVSFIKEGISEHDNIRLLTRDEKTGKEYYDNYEIFIQKIFEKRKVSRVIGYVKKVSYHMIPSTTRQELHQLFDEHILRDYSFILKIDVPTESFTPYFIEGGKWESYRGNRYYESFLNWWCQTMISSEEQKEIAYFLSLEQMLRILHSGEPSGYRFFSMKNSDTTYKYKIGTFAFYGSDVNTIILAVRDVNAIRSEEQYQEEENHKILTDVLNEAREAVESRKKFTNYIVSELSNPVMEIRELLHGNWNEATMKNISRCVDYIGEMIGSIEKYNHLDKLDSGKDEIVNLYQMCVKICEQERKISLGLDVSIKEYILLPEERYYLIHGFRFQEILVHLLGNALKYAPKGSDVYLRVEEERQPEGTDRIRITLKDEGPAINLQFYEREMDERYESEIRDKMLALGNAGYSIFLAGKMTELLGGSIEFHRGVVHQNVITIMIPVVRTEPAESPEDAGDENMIAKEADLGGQCILVVENESGGNRLLAPLLRVNGARVFTASSGKDAIRLLNRFTHGTFTVILVERELPDMDCYEFAREVKYMPNHSLRKIPVVELSDELQPDDTRSALINGINAVLNQPVNLPRLVAVIENLQRSGSNNRHKEGSE